MAYAHPQPIHGDPFPPLLVRSATVPETRPSPVAGSADVSSTSQYHSIHNRHHHRHHRQSVPGGDDAGIGAVPIDSHASPSLLTPEDAFITESAAARRLRSMRGDSRDRRPRPKRAWKKLLWVKQPYPDNYTDPATFLENLQRNPRLQPYDFWPLVADSTVIVQHVCSVIVFVVCFVGIFQERISPVSVVGWNSVATFLGWLLWERWVTEDEARYQEELVIEATAAINAARNGAATAQHGSGAGGDGGAAGGTGGGTTNPIMALVTATNVAVANVLARSGSSRRTGSMRRRRPTLRGDGVAPGAAAILAAAAAASAGSPRPGSQDDGSQMATTQADDAHGHITVESPRSISTVTSTPMVETPKAIHARHLAPLSTSASEVVPLPPLSPFTVVQVGRTHERLGTIKSAILIYFTLLAMSPILKSLTRSTSSDSIWAMSFWLLVINVFSFDYSSDDMSSQGGAAFPASLSTNAALMASTVLASRLPSTGHVFGLTLFSIEVFGLFPVFRRYVRDRSFRYHVLLTAALVLAAGAGVGIIISEPRGGGRTQGPWPWKGALAGSIVATCIAVMAMGGCSWWLISLQKYKNEIRGPWDPARPIIMNRRRWNHR